MKRWRVAVPVLVSVVAVAGVVTGVSLAAGGGQRKPPTPPAEAHFTGNQIALTRSVVCPQKAGRVPAARLAAFRPVTVVTCGQDVRRYPGDGQWTVDVRRLATGHIAPLHAALQRPDARPTTGACAAMLVVAPTMILVDAAGRQLVPAPPLDECGQPQRAVLSAFEAVSWREVSVRKVRQVVTPQAEASECPQDFKNMTYLEALMHAKSSPGGPIFDPAPRSVRICLYQVDAAAPESGSFDRSVTLSRSATVQLLAAMSRPGHPGACPVVPAFAAVMSGGDWATVELGGCWRVAQGSSMGTADPQVVGRLLSGN
jgi:hypothetical protein